MATPPLYKRSFAEENNQMGRKRKRDTSSKSTFAQNPFAAPRSNARSGQGKSAVANRGPLTAFAACLVLLVILAFQPALEGAFRRAAQMVWPGGSAWSAPSSDMEFGFVNLDDNRYIYDNSHVTQGLTRDSIAWAFTSLEYDNWHPLTWLSHMTDVQIFGPEGIQHPWGHHLTSVLLHAANVLVLFMALRRMTSALWPSFLVAILFGIHPLRAESVAWLSERKDVLSGLFCFLALWAYAAYADCARSWVRYARYGLVVVLFALGLMAKPMLVTLPVLLLLLDYWPLGRVRLPSPLAPLPEDEGSKRAVPRPKTQDLTPTTRSTGCSEDSNLLWLVLEKLPLVVLALASSAVTMVAQKGVCSSSTP